MTDGLDISDTSLDSAKAPSLSGIATKAMKQVDELGKETSGQKQYKADVDELRTSMKERKPAAFPEPPPEMSAKPPEPKQTSAMEAFGSFASLLGVFGGFFTKTPLVTSLQASTAAMNAIHKNDSDTYKAEMDRWKAQTDYALKVGDYQLKRYNAILESEDHTVDQKLNLLRAEGTGIQNDFVRQQAMTGDLQAAEHAVATLAQINEKTRDNFDKMSIGDQEYRKWLASQEGMEASLDERIAKHSELMMADPQTKADVEYKQAQTKKLNAEAEGGGSKPAEWEILTDPAHKDAEGKDVPAQQYRYNKVHANATTLGGEPYTPSGAAKLGGASQGSVISKETAHFIAERIAAGDPDATKNMSRTKENMTMVENELTALAKERRMSAGQLSAAIATVKADRTSLSSLTKMTDAAVSFENTASRNFDLALKLAPGAVPTTWGPWINRWVMEGETFFGDKNVPPYVMAMLTGANEYAKIMSGSTGAQGSTVDSRKEAASIFSPYLSKGQINEVVKVAKQDMNNRKTSLFGQVQAIKDRIVEQGDSGESSGAPKPTATDAQGNQIEWDGKAWVPK